MQKLIKLETKINSKKYKPKRYYNKINNLINKNR